MSQTFQPYSFQPSTDSNIEHPITISSSSASPVINSSQNPKPQEQVSKPQQGSDSELEEGEIIVKQVYSHDSSSEESSPEQRVASKSRSKPQQQQQQSYRDRGRFRDEGKRDFNLKENTKGSSMNKYYDNKAPQKHQPYYEQSKPYYFDQKKQGPANIPPQNNQRSNQGYQNQRNPNNIQANPPPYTSFANQNPPVSGPFSGSGNQPQPQQMNYQAPQNQPPQSTSQYYQNTQPQPQPYYSNNPPANVNMSHNNPAPFQGPPQNFNNMQNFQKPPNSYPGPQGVAPNQGPQNTSYYNPPPQQQQQQQQQQHAATALGFNIQYGVNQNNQVQQPSMPPQQQHQQQFMNAPQMIQGSNMNQGNVYNNPGAHSPYYQNNPNQAVQQQQQPGLQQPFNVQNPHMLAPQQQVQNLVQPQMQDQKPNPISPYYQNPPPQQHQQHQQNINQGYYRGGYSQPPQFGNNPPFNAQPQMQPQIQPQQQLQMQPQVQQLQPQLQPQMQQQTQPQLQSQIQQPQLQPQIQQQQQQQQQPQYAPPQFSPRQPYQMPNVNMTPPTQIPSGPHQPFVMQSGSSDLIIKTPFSTNFNPNQPQAPETTFPNYYQPPFNKPPPTVIQDQTTLPVNNNQENNVKPISVEPPVQIPERPQSQPTQPNEGVIDLTNSPPLGSQSKSVPPPPDAALKNVEPEKKILKFFIDSVPIGKVTVNSEEENKTKKVETVKTIETEEKQYKLIGHDRWFRTQEKNLLEKLNKFLIPSEVVKEEKKKEPVNKEKESMEKGTPEGKEKEEEIDDFNFETRYFMYNPTQVCNRCKKPGHFERMCTEDVVLRCMFCLGSHRMEECSQIVCFNCYGVGHRIRDCTLQESITCYRCGKKGHKNTRCGVLMPRDKEQLKREKKDYNISTKCSVCGNYGHPICQKNPVPSFGGGYLDDMYIEESFTESAEGEEGSLKRANSGSNTELENALDISPKKKLKTDKKDSINREVSS